MISANVHKDDEPMQPKSPKNLQNECMNLRRENLKLQEELLLRSSEVYQLILRTAKVNCRMKKKMEEKEKGDKEVFRRGNSLSSMINFGKR